MGGIIKQPLSHFGGNLSPVYLLLPYDFIGHRKISQQYITVERQNENLDVYYNPLTISLIYWAQGCSLPASPSEGTTYLFGYSDVAHVGGGSVKDRLVLVTCRVPDAELDVIGYKTVICANQAGAMLI